ncbi:MAG: matrixin family metalloprotease [Nanoarchaeota archaeon]
MGLKTFLSGILVFLLIILLVLYWFVPFQTIEFITNNGHSNFSLYNFDSEMQFYKNMRFPQKEISYKIYNCPLNQQGEMFRAFEIMGNETILEFSPVLNDEEITISCDSKNRVEGGLFIAGEGGPTNIIKTNNFNVISKGNIILIKESKCPKPNVAIHELLHVLGFNHSENSNNIMYPISNCKQTLGDIPNLINDLYSVESYPDLEIENISAVMEGKYLDMNISIRNSGLAKSQNTEMIISSGDTIIKRTLIEPLDIGYGMQITFTNVWVPKLNVEEIEFLIDASFSELDKNNNKKILKIKK